MTSKTQPRPILKKDNQKSTKHHPLFFSGNEQLLQEEEDEHSCEKRYQLEHDKLCKQIDFKKLNLSPTSSASHFNNEHFKKSCLKSKLNPKNAHKPSNLPIYRKRPLSTVYIFHSKEIDAEIMKFLIKSTHNFIEDFKSSILSDYYEESQLFTTFKDKFLAKLKEFLINGESLISDQVPACNLGVTLSEPSIPDIETFRIKASHDLLSTSRSQQFSRKFSKENFGLKPLDENMQTFKTERRISKLVDSVYGSLPTTSYLENESNELNLRENVLLKSIRYKNLKTNQDSLLLAHAHAAFNKAPKDKNKSIVSTATTTKKIVRFADSFGLDLENVKIITNNSFMDAFSQEKHEEEIPEEDSVNSTGTVNSNQFLVLIPLFGIRKTDAMIRLEDYMFDYENKIIKCIVRVKNFSYEKRVFARITLNNWKSFYDLDAIYIKSDKNSSKDKLNSNQILYDLFGFCILIPEKSTLAINNFEDQTTKPLEDCILRVEFALCCVQNGVPYWDSNAGENYKFQCFYNKNN